MPEIFLVWPVSLFVISDRVTRLSNTPTLTYIIFFMTPVALLYSIWLHLGAFEFKYHTSKLHVHNQLSSKHCRTKLVNIELFKLHSKINKTQLTTGIEFTCTWCNVALRWSFHIIWNYTCSFNLIYPWPQT